MGHFRWLALGLCITACSDSSTEVCSDGRLCPNGFVCVEGDTSGCALPAQIDACEGAAEGASCTVSDNESVCIDGICQAGDCGDGVATVGEACDDGNREDGDGCSANCLSTETCGNGFVDEGEECDCGSGSLLGAGCDSVNSDEAGATCKADCTAHCGDGEVNAAEDCEGDTVDGGCFAFGFDRGPLLCSTSCAADFSECREFGVKSVGGPGVLGQSPRTMWLAEDGTVALGNGRTVEIRTGDAWTTNLLPSSGFDNYSIRGISGSSGQDIWGVGQFSFFDGSNGGGFGFSIHWDGSQWSEPATFLFGGNTTVEDLWVVSPTDILAVGRAINSSVFENDGANWSAGPNVSATQGLKAIHGAGNYVLAVGEDNALWRIDGVWQSEQTVPGATQLESVWVESGGIAYAGGTAGQLFRYDGQVWTEVQSNTSDDINEIFGQSPDDLFFAAGDTLFHNDGTGWMQVVGPQQQVTAGGTSGAQNFAAGQHFALYRIFDEGWRASGSLSAPNQGGCDIAEGVVYVARTTELSRWESGTLNTISSGFFNSGVAALEADMVLQAAYNPFTNRTQVLLYDEAVFGGDDPAELRSVPGSYAALSDLGPTEYALAVNCMSCSGEVPRGIVHKFTDGTWTEHGLLIAEGDELVALEYIDGIAHGLTETGQIWRFDGTEFVPFETVPEGGARRLWGLSSELYVGGQNGALWHFADDEWTLVSLDEQQIIAIEGTSLSDVVATTVNAGFHFDGSNWSRFSLPDQGVFDICMGDDGDIYASLVDGRMGRLRRVETW